MGYKQGRTKARKKERKKESLTERAKLILFTHNHDK
jgi:hypothetical protein